ncbi:MAG: hypothetical protein LC799_33800, partial [Actinobacteria bacterium]|nr:hypothetical protein [Actinomycetota bacterium]
VVGAALSTAVRHAPWYERRDDEEDLDDRLSAIADDVDLVMRDVADPSLEQRLRVTIDGWLRGSRPVPIRPLHWPLEFPVSSTSTLPVSRSRPGRTSTERSRCSIAHVVG